MRSLLLLFLTLLLHHQSVIYRCGVETVTVSPTPTIRTSQNANNISSIHLKNIKRSSSLDSDYAEEEEEDDDDDYYEEYGEDGTNSKSSDDNLQAKESHRVDVDDSRLRPSSLLAEDEDFCSDTFVDSAYFNGYDYILTRGDRLWYYYKDRHRLSKAYDQRRFTQGDHIQGAFNISRTPYYCLNRRTRSSHINVPSSVPAYATFEALRNNKNIRKKIQSSQTYNNNNNNNNKNNNNNNNSSSHRRQINEDGPNTGTGSAQADCVELQKLRSMAVYFLHNKERTRSYYNLDVRHPNGTQRRVRSRDLPWNMKQVGLLGGNLWPNGWEAYQQFRPVAFLPSRFEVIFILNHPRNPRSIRNSATAAPSPVLTWNNLDSNNWNNSWRSKVLQFDPPVLFTGMFEMNGIVYAIGEERPKMITPNANIKRIGQMFRYYITDNDGRDLRKMNQTVLEFFGCIKPKTATSSVPKTESSTMSTTTSTEKISVAPTFIKINPKINRLIPSTTTTAESIITSSTPSTTTTMSKEEEKSEEFNEISEETKVDSKEKPLNNEETMSFKKSILLNQSKLNSDEQPIPKRPSDSSETSSPSVFLRNSRAKITSFTPNASRNGVYSGSYSSGTKLASPFATAGLRETDSIMLTILIAIVIGASILCIVLACLVINGKKRHLPPHFEGAHRIEPTIPKPSIIGLDYHRRKNSTSSSLTPFNFLTRYDSMNSLSAIYSHVHQRNRLSPMAEPCPSPNLHALHPPPPPPPPPPLQESLAGSSRNIILHHHHHQHPTDSGGPILHNKAVSVNLTKHKSGHQSSSSLMNNSNSVPNLVSEVNKTSPQNMSPISSSNQLQISQQQHFNRQMNSNNRIKSFERFDNLI